MSLDKEREKYVKMDVDREVTNVSDQEIGSHVPSMVGIRIIYKVFSVLLIYCAYRQ